MSPQSRSGGGGGMQTVGEDGSQLAGGAVGARVSGGGRGGVGGGAAGRVGARAGGGGAAGARVAGADGFEASAASTTSAMPPAMTLRRVSFLSDSCGGRPPTPL